MSLIDSTVVGVDSCPFGWFTTIINGTSVNTEIYKEFEKISETYTDANQILVDIPVGLPEKERRLCDESARDLLGCRGNSVFYPPCCDAAVLTDYEEANEAHHNQIGYGLSQQAYHISEKILEVADVVGDQYDGLVRESHPELCFAALNGQPIAYSKSSDQGRGLRMKLLSDEIDSVEILYRDARNEYTLQDVRRDDILDSIVLAVSAQKNNLTSVPSNPSSDQPRIYYPDFEVPMLQFE